MGATASDRPPEWLGFSLKSMLTILVGIVLFIWYVSALLFGDNSLQALNKLKHDKAALLQKTQALQLSNQKLQKEYFELLQLSGE